MERKYNSKQVEISLKELIFQLWQRKILIMVVTGLFVAGAVIFSLSLPNKYQAEVMLIPSEDGQGGGLASLASQFGGLAGMTGMNLAGNVSKKPQIALQLLKSKTFLIDFIKKNQLEVLLFAAKDWDPKIDTIIINDELYDTESKLWVREFEFPKTLVPSEQEVYEQFIEMIEFVIDNREGTFRISVEYFSPKLAALWANMLVHDINEHMRQIDITQANKSIDFLNQQLNNTRLKATETVFFSLIEEQTKKTMLAQVQEDYVFVIIDPAIAPENKSNPKRALICILFFLLGGVLACGYVLMNNIFVNKDK